MMLASVGFGAAIVVCAFAPFLGLAYAALPFVGWASVSFIAIGNSTIQLTAEPGMRGRVISLWQVAWQSAAGTAVPRETAASVAAMLLGGAAGAASASTASVRPQHPVSAVRLSGGQTVVTTAPGIAAALLGHGIVPLATLPGTEGVGTNKSGVAVRFSFPVTGGSVNLQRLTGTIGHRGGIDFIALASGKHLAVSDFVINLKERVLTAIVDGNPKVRVPLLWLGLGHAKIVASRHAVRVSAVVVRLTKTAASALDATFGTSLFTPGLELGTAGTLVRF